MSDEHIKVLQSLRGLANPALSEIDRELAAALDAAIAALGGVGEADACLAALQAYIDREGGLVLHNGTHGGGPYCGLGLANTGRTLRAAAKELFDYKDQDS